MNVEQHYEFKGLKTHQERIAFTHGWYAALESKERHKTVRAKRPAQQAKDAFKPADYEYCPHCYGSFSFAKLGSNFKCKWCKKDVRTSVRLA